MVLRCLRDAPLDILPAKVWALEERRGLLSALAELQTAVEGIDAKVANPKCETEKLAHEL